LVVYEVWEKLYVYIWMEILFFSWLRMDWIALVGCWCNPNNIKRSIRGSSLPHWQELGLRGSKRLSMDFFRHMS